MADLTNRWGQDEQVSGVTMTRNVIHRVEDEGFYFHCGSDNAATNNIIASAGTAPGQWPFKVPDISDGLLPGMCNSGGNPTWPDMGSAVGFVRHTSPCFATPLSDDDRHADLYADVHAQHRAAWERPGRGGHAGKLPQGRATLALGIQHLLEFQLHRRLGAAHGGGLAERDYLAAVVGERVRRARGRAVDHRGPAVRGG